MDKDEEKRRDVLQRCQHAQAEWARSPGRNLVLLFDGTGNILGNRQDTNVVKLLRLLRKDKGDANAGIPEQIVYYDPGVGTNNDFPPAGFAARLRSTLWQLGGLALGRGAFENIAEGYEFLCRTWQPGDRIFLFGFSRGAFTARAVGGMVNMFGLVQATGFPLIRVLVRTYFAGKEQKGRDEFAQDVRRHFGQGLSPLVHFTGVWDTVESVGLTGRLKITNGKGKLEGKSFTHIRHALSLHETRLQYTPREYVAPNFRREEGLVRSFDQRWFRGVHSDVGGSYSRSGLSNIALHWMVREACEQGLVLAHDADAQRVDSQEPPAGELLADHPEEPASAMHDQVLESPFWVLTGVDARDWRRIDAPLHPSAAQGTPTPARLEPEAWLVRDLRDVLAGGTVLTGVLALLATHSACTGSGWRWVPAAMQLLAPLHDRLGLACSPHSIREAVNADWWFIAFYGPLLVYALAAALRAWIARLIPHGRTLPRWARNGPGVLVALVTVDLAENLATLRWLDDSAWAMAPMLLCGLKFALAAWLAAIVWWGWRPQAEPRASADLRSA